MLAVDQLPPWFGALLLSRGHLVQCPPGHGEVWVHVKKGVRRIAVSPREAVVSRTEGRAIVGRIADLVDNAPDAIVLVCAVDLSFPAISIVPVKSTRDAWLTEGRHYTIAGEQLVNFEHLNAYLTAQGKPA